MLLKFICSEFSEVHVLIIHTHGQIGYLCSVKTTTSIWSLGEGDEMDFWTQFKTIVFGQRYIHYVTHLLGKYKRTHRTQVKIKLFNCV